MTITASERVADVLPRVNEELQKGMRLCFATRGAELQQESVDSLAQLMADIDGLKDEVIADRDEDAANTLLGVVCVIQAVALRDR